MASVALYTNITNHTMMSKDTKESKDTKVTLKVEDDTHRKLLEIVSRLQLKTGKRVTIDEAIQELMNHAKD